MEKVVSVCSLQHSDTTVGQGHYLIFPVPNLSKLIKQKASSVFILYG